MATRLKNILRHPIFKLFLYISFGLTVFCFGFFTVNGLLSDKDGKYFKNFTYESFLIDDFFESSYVNGIISLAFLNLEGLASEFSEADYTEIFQQDKINFIPRNFKFKFTEHPFVADRKFSYYIETDEGYKFASEDLQDLKSKEEIVEKIYESSLYAWIDYRIDEMGMDSDSSSKLVRAKLSNKGFFSDFGEMKNLRAVYVSYNDKILNIARNEWNIAQKHYTNIKQTLLIALALILLILLLLLAGTGRRPKSDQKIEHFFDAVFIEFKIALLFPILIQLEELILFNLNTLSNSNYRALIISSFSTFLCYLSLIIVMSIVRNLKSDKWKMRSLIYCLAYLFTKMMKFLIDFLVVIFHPKKSDAQKMNRKIHRYVNSYVLLSFFLMIFAFASLFFFADKKLALVFFLTELFLSFGFLVKTKQNLALLDEEFKHRVKEASKSEKMKTELITNVSHDLKSPLTSIIAYLDLLKKEDLDEVARDYTVILDQKANKLKDIIEDLFVLSKSESGNMDMDLQVIDLKKLVRQTLATMEDKIELSGLQIKTSMADTQLYIKSDGKKLYRVLQNLIDNALKYSLKGTRIFISLESSIDNRAIFRIKNTSSYEMNFSKEEITARFVRGDKSRSDDGSGLGLAIVESFTNALGGSFELKIDGDLFIVELEFEMIEG